MWKDAASEINIDVSKSYEGVTIVKNLYGGSYLVRLGETEANGFLHKLHARAGEEEEEKDKEEKHVGTRLEGTARIKEINWFDGMPIVSLKQHLGTSAALNYHEIKVGQTFEEAKISKVDAEGRFVELKLSEFVIGRLYLEHMAE